MEHILDSSFRLFRNISLCNATHPCLPSRPESNGIFVPVACRAIWINRSTVMTTILYSNCCQYCQQHFHQLCISCFQYYQQYFSPTLHQLLSILSTILFINIASAALNTINNAFLPKMHQLLSILSTILLPTKHQLLSKYQQCFSPTLHQLLSILSTILFTNIASFAENISKNAFHHQCISCCQNINNTFHQH